MSCVRQSPILYRGRVGMMTQMEKSATFARGTSSKCLVTRSSLNGRISNRNACEGKRSFRLPVIRYRLLAKTGAVKTSLTHLVQNIGNTFLVFILSLFSCL